MWSAPALAAITLSPVVLPNGTQTVAYDQTITASGGTGPYTYAVTTGSLPSGLSLDGATGEITGTPDHHRLFQLHHNGDRFNERDGQPRVFDLGRHRVADVVAVIVARGNAGHGLQPDDHGGRGNRALHILGFAGSAARRADLVERRRAQRHADRQRFFRIHPPGDRRQRQHRISHLQPGDRQQLADIYADDPAERQPGHSLTAKPSRRAAAARLTRTRSPAVRCRPDSRSTASSGAVSGTPTGSGTSNFTVGATDTFGDTGSQPYSLTIGGEQPSAQSNHAVQWLPGHSL